MAAAANDRFASMLSELGETAPLQTPVRHASNPGARPFRAQIPAGAGVSMADSYATTPPRSGSDLSAHGGEGDRTDSDGATRRETSGMALSREPLHVTGSSVAAAWSSNPAEHDLGAREARRDNVQSSKHFGSPTPPLAADDDRRGRGGRRKWREKLPLPPEEQPVLPSVEEARRAFEAQQAAGTIGENEVDTLDASRPSRPSKSSRSTGHGAPKPVERRPPFPATATEESDGALSLAGQPQPACPPQMEASSRDKSKVRCNDNTGDRSSIEESIGGAPGDANGQEMGPRAALGSSADGDEYLRLSGHVEHESSEGATVVSPELLRFDSLTDAAASLARSGSDQVLHTAGRDSGVGGGPRGGRDCGGCTISHAMVGPITTYAQALHMAFAFVILVLVAFAKAGDAPIAHRATYGGGLSGADSSARRTSKPRRKSGVGVGRSSMHKSPLLRRLRATWSKLWHAVEDHLKTRWHAAGQALASLRKAWAALWVPRPHPEADVLAQALAIPPRCFGESDDRLSRAAGGVAGGSLERRRRRSRSERSARSAALGAEEGEEALRYQRRPAGLNCMGFLSLCGYRPLATVGGGRSSRSRSPKFLLLLDLDETLVHCSPRLPETSRRRSGAAGRAGAGPDLKVEMRGGAPSERPACMYAWKRPHLDLFLSVVSRWYELAVFTSSRRRLAEPLIDLMDSRCVISKRFYRDSCVRQDATPAGDGAGALGPHVAHSRPVSAQTGAAAGAGFPFATMKDLRVVGSELFPLRTVLMDNQPKSVVQQANVLPVKSWYPTDTEDRQLLELLPLLLALTSCQDVRSVLGLRPGVEAPTAAFTRPA